MAGDNDFISQFRLLDEFEQESRIETLFLANWRDLLHAKELPEAGIEQFSLGEPEVLAINLTHPNEIRAQIAFTLTCDDEWSCYPVEIIDGLVSVLVDNRGDLQVVSVRAERLLGERDELDRRRNKRMTCRECGKTFARDDETYDFCVCPKCLEHARAKHDKPKDSLAKCAKQNNDWAMSILDFCKVCKKPYKNNLLETVAPKICPECLQCQANDPSDVRNKPPGDIILPTGTPLTNTNKP